MLIKDLTCGVLLTVLLVSNVYAESLEQLVDSRPSVALKLLRQQLETDPTDVKALFLQARVMENLGRKDQATSLYLQLIEREPQSPEPYVNLAALYASDGQIDKAKDTLNDGAQAHPGFASLFANLRQINGALAARAYKQALNKDVSKPSVSLSKVAQLSLPQREVVVKEVPVEVVKEVVKEVPVEVVKEVIKEVPVEVVKEVIKEVPVEVVKEVPVQQNVVKVETVASTALPDLQDRVQAWAKAWSAQDVPAYISFYSDAYAPGRLSNAQWREDRQNKLTNKEFIEVAVSDFDQETKNDQILVSFNQQYRSNIIADTIRKQLVFQKQAGDWRIVSEAVIGR